MENIKYETGAGEHFDNVAANAKLIAEQRKVNVEFDFNGVTCVVDENTNLVNLYRDYSNSWTMEWKLVGPNCVDIYDAETEALLALRNKEKAKKQAEQEAEWREKDAKEKLTADKEVEGVEIEFSDLEGFNLSKEKNSDPYGAAAIQYAEYWAKKMQKEISKGKSVQECYDSTQEGLGFLGITGFQFGCAVSILSQTWKHGKELRSVHNKKYGIKEDIEGTANPAILTIN